MGAGTVGLGTWEWEYGSWESRSGNLGMGVWELGE